MTDHLPGAGKVTDDTEGDISDATLRDSESTSAEDRDSNATLERSETDPATGDATEKDEPDTFPRAYVEQLRNENAKYRQRAGEADALAQRLHTELVRATGRLADPTDLPFDPEHLESDNLSLALDELLAVKPHLAARRPTGDIGQGMSGQAATVDLAAILRGKAG